VNKPLLLLTFSILLFSIACKKTDTSPSTSTSTSSTSTTTSTDSLLGTQLINIYEVDTLITSSNGDTISKRSFTYDVNNRIIADSIINYNSFPTISAIDIKNYFYNNYDTIVNKRIHKSITFTGLNSSEIDDTTFYTFSGGLIIKDSITSSDPTMGITTNDFTYGTNSIIINQQNWKKIPSINYTQNIQNISIVNDYNTSFQIDSITTKINNLSPSQNIITVSTNYNSYKNPFLGIYKNSQINFFNSIQNQYGIGNLINSEYAPNNQITQQTIVNNNTNATNYIFYYYELRKDGLPNIVFVNNYSINGNKFTKLIFTYK